MDKRQGRSATAATEPEFGRGDAFEAAIRGTRMPIAISDPRRPGHPIVFVNEAFEALTGYVRDEVVGRNCRFLQGPDTDPACIAQVSAAINAGETIDVELLNYRKDGSRFWNALHISPVRGADGSIEHFFASQLDVTTRVEAQRTITAEKVAIEALISARTAELEAALAAQTTLLKEVDHRVKNNLAMIGALVRLQARSLPEPGLRASLDTMLGRIDALSAVHRRLYQSEDIRKFDVGAFAAELARDAVVASGRADIVLTTEIETAEIDAAKAAAVGIVLNELVTNAIRHGFAGDRPGQLALQVRVAAGVAEIGLRDDGPGFDANEPQTGSVGRALIDRLSKQIGATLRWDGRGPGTKVVLNLPLCT